MTGAIGSEILAKYEGEAISAEKKINEKVSNAFKNPYASRRWFWDHLQNAVDTLSDEVWGKLRFTEFIEDLSQCNGKT